ncbi:fungal-specific transcription factor domain protein [Rhizoctonia solani AG-3 Rhs1AP]|uniref:Fungal-specific transcription factor domain protein n=2 Tax=Rhizoctonia solani AG-3 TaxID=1086053 RepID=A0A074RSZ7_9AGAM|nr:fungal-specific transcription factor domain protein [Rhizoctonia solani AG-3 Rhs1AP]KEP50009.1 fungal-specific transcription factor domain protein [Rhizoctonia solani 123E]
MPVPFLSFEGLRGRLSNGASSLASPTSLDYGATSGAMDAFDELESTDGSDGEVHFQLQPLNTRKEALVICKSPEPIESTTTSPERTKGIDAPVKEKGLKAEGHSPNKVSVSNEAPTENQPATRESSSSIASSITRPCPEDQELSHYINHIFPVLHELAGFNLSTQELLTLSQREPTVRTTLLAQVKHHQNRMKFLTSTDGPHHQTTQKLCLDLAASNNGYVSALGALSPVFEKATRANDVDTLAILYTLLHFGGIGELLTRHIARRGNQGSSGNGFLLELSCRWLASSIARYADLASALRRGSERQRAVLQAAIHIDIYSSIALCRPPHFLDSYRASFRHGDMAATTDSNGVRMAVPRLDDLMDIPGKTLLALAEMSAMASWKAEHLRHGTLSVMDLSRWAKRIDVLLAPPSAELLMPLGPLPLNPKRPPQLTGLGTKDRPPSGTAPKGPSPESTVQSVNNKPVSATANAVSPTISNPATPTAIVLRSEGEPREGAKASTPIMPPTPVDQTPRGTLPTPNPATDTTDREMTDVEVVTRVAPKSPVAERPAVPPTPADQNRQGSRPPYRRILPPATREVFRCASRVFLHTILSGEHPRVHDIVQAVADTCGALRDLGVSYLPPGSRPAQTDDLRFPVVRGLPFCIFIAGCMAGNMEQGMFLRSCLRPVIREIDMQTSELLTAVLSERAGSGDAISWQSVMVKRGARLVFM